MVPRKARFFLFVAKFLPRQFQRGIGYEPLVFRKRSQNAAKTKHHFNEIQVLEDALKLPLRGGHTKFDKRLDVIFK